MYYNLTLPVDFALKVDLEKMDLSSQSTALLDDIQCNIISFWIPIVKMLTRPKCGKRKWTYLLNWWKRASQLLGQCVVLFSLVCRLLRRRRRLLRFLVSQTVGSRVVSLIWESLAAFHWVTIVANSKYSRPFLGSSIKENIPNTIEAIHPGSYLLNTFTPRQ